MKRHFSLFDRFIRHADDMLHTLGSKPIASRPSPAIDAMPDRLNEAERQESIRLMRVNHTGEVCAQALYQGQSVTTRSSQLRKTFQQAAEEENDHLAWCEQRVKSLHGNTSKLNPLFYLGSFGIGAVAGVLGDRVSATFLAETEYQVVDHLSGHLQRLPPQDASSRLIVVQMREDELKHATTAEQAGTIELPQIVKTLMRGMSKIMTSLSYRI